MRNSAYFAFLFCLLASQHIASQNDCEHPMAPPQKAELIDFPLFMNNSGNLWALYPGIGPGQEIPYSLGALWLTAFRPDGGLTVAAHTNEEETGGIDFFPGPLNDSGEPVPEWCDIFDRTWKITAQEIEDFRKDWYDNQHIDKPIPEPIQSWPASGNFHYWENYQIPFPFGWFYAPFWDQNFNQVYEPESGDYPLIEGDAALWKMINDKGGVHGETQGFPLGVQASIMAYTFQSNDPVYANAVFYHVEIRNRTPDSLLQCKGGIWIYNEWHCPLLQRWTVIPEEDLVYFFDTYSAGDTCDPPGDPESKWGWWLGLKVLRSSWEFFSPGNQPNMDGVVYYRDPFAGNPPPGTTSPQIDSEYYRYLSNSWRDGTPFTYGGDGYQTGAPGPYVFPDPMNDPEGWSDCTSEWPDHKLYSLVNLPLGNFQPGNGGAFFDFVLFRIPAPGIECPSQTWLKIPAHKLETAWEWGLIDTREPVTESDAFRIFPNPVCESFTIECREAASPFSWTIWHLQGEKVAEGDCVAGSVTIQTAAMPSGMYWIEVWNGAGKQKGKLVVQKY